MSDRPNDDLRAKLFLAAMRADSAFQAGSRFLELDSDGNPEKLDVYVELVQWSAPTISFAKKLESAAGKIGFPWTEAAVLGRLFFREGAPSVDSLTSLELTAVDRLPGDSFAWVALRALQSGEARARGDLKMANYYLRDATERTAEVRHPLISELMDSILSHAQGLLAQTEGNFALALSKFKNSSEISKRHGTRLAPIAAMDLAGLHWASGQYARALELHTDEHHRSEDLERLGPAWSLRSHLSAAKCAIDCGKLLIAETELRAAEQLLRETAGLPEMLQGYYLLYSGELDLTALEGNSRGGFDLLEKACQIFESMDPPYHAGLLDAKISITQYAIRTDDYKRLFAILHNILEEAEQKGCLEARARCLVFESSLFVSESPPLRAAFDDLVTRLHLINNPALLMQALANLFAYSLRYLEQPDQAFLMARLRNLQEVLDESCYQDLYESYIEKRYSWAIENRLAEFLETDEKLFEDEGDKEPTT